MPSQMSLSQLDSSAIMPITKVHHEPGFIEHYEPYVLSRHPVQAQVADRGYISTTFIVDRNRYTTYVGFGKRPTGRNPYLRFLIVKAQNLDEPHIAEGVVLIEDPMGSSTSKSGQEPLKLLKKRSVNDSTYALSVMCYRVAWGLHNMLTRLEILGGKNFEPFQDTLELLSVPIIGQIMGSFVADPQRGFDTTMTNLVLPPVVSEGDSIPLLKFFALREKLQAYPKLWESFAHSDRSESFVWRISQDYFLTNGEDGRIFTDPGGLPLLEDEVKLLLTSIGVADHEDWLKRLSIAELLSLAKSAWVYVLSSAKNGQEPFRIEMDSSHDYGLRASLHFESSEVISGGITRIFHAMGLG